MLKRCTSILLAFLLAISCIPMQVFATEDTVITEDEPIFLNEEDYPISSMTDDYVDIDETESVEDIASSPGETTSAEGSVQAVGTPESGDETAGVALFSENSNAALLSETDNPAACGESLSWSYDENSKTLTISGSGAMTNYGSASAVPWYANMAVIEAVVIEAGATTVGDYAFYGASALKTVSIPSGIEIIGKYAFYKCSALEEAVLPDSVTALGYRCFASCTSLNQINIPLNWSSCPSYSSTVNADCCGHIFQDCTNLTSVIVPEGMTTLPTYAFAFCNKLVSVSLPSTLMALPSQAFYNCSALESIDIPEGVTTIGKSAFCYCSSLADVDIPNGVTELALFAFYECKALTEVQLPDSITSMGYQCFYNCTNLSSINIPQNWTDTPSSNTNGTMNANYCGHIFQGCKSLKSLTIPEGLTLPSYALCYSDYLETVTLPSTITEIKNHTFYNCTRLTSIEVPTGVTYIGKSAFCYCNALTEVTLPAYLTELALYAFYNCKALAEVQLPDSITSIGWQCFADCTNLTTINLPLSWTEVPSSSTNGTMNTDYCGHIFQGCKKLTTITIPDGLTVPAFGLCYSDYVETVNLPANATRIEALTFYGCSRLKNVEIPNSVTYIGKSAFNSCDALEKINIPDGITEIVSYTFDGCESLAEIDIPETVTKIGAYAFNDCKTLMSVEIPNSVTGIGYHAFANCVNLTDVTLSSNWTECLSNSTNGTMGTSYCGGIFYGCTSLLTITVPEGVATLPEYAFANCNNLKSVKLPSTLTTIPAYVFYDCSNLLLIQIPENVTKIDKYAFYNCSATQMINVPESVEEIGNYAFRYCNESAAVNYSGSEENWGNISVASSGNSVITNASVNYNQKFDTTYGVVRPTSLGNCFYSSPDEVSFTDFYGGYCNSSSNESVIDVNHAFFGLDAYDLFVSIPRDSFITLRLPNVVYFGNDSYLYLKTTGIVDERADLYAVTSGGNLQFLDTIVEDKESHTIKLNNVDEGVVGLKFVGKDLDGDSPGFDIVDVYLLTHQTEIEADYNTNTTVSMTRGDDTYNLLREQQSFEQGDTEAVTIIVTPDWQGKEIGHIEISQGGKTILKNAGGAFVDVVPGDIFSPLESVYATLVDAEGNIVESLKLKIKITLPPVSRLNSSTTEISLTVYENKKDSGNRFDDYQVSSGAKITVNGTMYTTNSRGIVKIPTLTEGSITVEKGNFITRTITADQLKASKKIYLQKASDGKPVVSAVWVGTTDVLNQSCAIGLLSKEKTTFTAEVDWGNSSYGGIALMQDARTVKFSGTTLTTVLSDNFDVSETIYIVATDAAGNTTKKALKFESGTVSAVPNILDGAGFSISDKISITLPNNIKPDFFAGQKINVGVSSLIPVTVSAEDGKVYVAIGVDLVNYESKDNWASNSSGDTAHALSGKFRILHKETKRYVDQFKNTGILDTSGAANSIKKLKNLEQVYKTAIKYPQGSFGFDANFTILGFAEGYYDEQGNVTWLDGGVVFNPSVSVSTNLPFSLGPVPMYFEASLSADVQAQLNIIFNKAAKNFTPNGEVSGTIALSGGVGFGIKKVLYGGGGVEGKLMPDWHIYDNKQDYFKLSASVNAYAKVGIAFFEYKKNWDPFYNAVWVEYPKANAAAASLMSVSDFYDTTNYEVKDLSYLNEGSAFIADGRSGGATLMSLVPSAAYLSENLLKTNIYRESTPQFVTFADGSKLAVWLDASNSDINSIVLYYSYFNGTKWSNPAAVYQDGTLDYTPQLVLIGNTAYLTWQNATKVFATTDDLEDIAPHFDVSLAEFNPTAGFVASTITSDGLDMLPTICGTESSVYLVWVKNSQNDWFGNNTANSICYSTYEDGTFSEVVAAYSNLNAIDSLVADHDGSLNIAYCLDMDGDLSTSDDVRLYKNGARVSSAEVSEACPQYVGNTLYWNSNGIVVSEAESETSEVGAVSNYQIVEGNGTKVLVYTESNGLASTLNASYYNEETQMWCEPYELSDGSTFIGAFSAAMSENGVLEVLATSQEVTGTYEDDDPYGEAALTLVSLEPYCDLAMGELVYSEDQYSAGDDMEFSFDLTNCGSQTINSATITVSDDQGTVLSSITMDDVLVPGQTITTSTYFNIDAAATGQNIIITVIPDELTDVNDADNSQSATLAFEDLSVEQASWGMQADGTKTLSANIVNYGYAARQNILVELREGSIDGIVVETTTIASLDVLSLDTVSFDLVGQNSEVYFISIKDSGDTFTANDHDYVAILAGETDCITIDKISADSAQLYLENDQAGRCIVAIYNADGKMLTCGMADVTENAGEISVPYLPFTCDADYTVKVFLVNSSFAPICECVTKEY